MLLNLAESAEPEVKIPLSQEYVSFTFCRHGSLWAHLAVFFMTFQGSVRFRTPILPRIAVLPALVVAQLRSTQTEEFAREVVGPDKDPAALIQWLRTTLWSSGSEVEQSEQSVRVRHSGSCALPSEQTLTVPPMDANSFLVAAYDPVLVVARAGEAVELVTMASPVLPAFEPAELEASVFETLDLNAKSGPVELASCSSAAFTVRTPTLLAVVRLPWLADPQQHTAVQMVHSGQNVLVGCEQVSCWTFALRTNTTAS
jgi:hypothetical protein